MGLSKPTEVKMALAVWKDRQFLFNLLEPSVDKVKHIEVMYANKGEKLNWTEFDEKRAKREFTFIGDSPKDEKEMFLKYAHSHTKAETEKWLDDNDMNLDIMYNENGRPDCYDKWNGECCGVYCTDVFFGIDHFLRTLYIKSRLL